MSDGGTSPFVRVVLVRGKEKAILEGHPWLFSGAIAKIEGADESPLAVVETADGRVLGVGFYSPRSQIRVRLLAPGLAAERVDRTLFAERIESALALRRTVLPPETTGYRLLNSEGDGLPGWTVDVFGDALVSQITVAGLETLRGEAYAALAERFPKASITQVNDVPARRAEGLPRENEVVSGAPPKDVEFLESGLRFTADLEAGQKTGFYCDQRENRRRTERFAGGRRVLDLFAHSGAFGVYALRGGAERITFVESAAKLIERGRRHVARNGFSEQSCEWVQANVFEDLRSRTDLFDLVVCDPPPLSKKRADLDAAARAYKDLNRLALKRLAPGGLLLTFTCSGGVDAKLFRQILFAAAVEAGANVSLLEPLAAAPDHPVSIAHREGEYLKGWLAMVR